MLAFCKPVEVIEAADAGQKECKAGPVVFCQPLPAGSNDEGCSSDDPSSKLLTELPRGVRELVAAGHEVLLVSSGAVSAHRWQSAMR